MTAQSRYALAILSGILIGTSYIPFPPWAVFFGFVPLWYVWLRAESASQIFWTGWTTQFVLTLIGFNWVIYTVHEFGHMPWPIAALVLFLFCALAHLHVPIAGAIWFWAARRFKFNETRRLIGLAVFMALSFRFYPMIFQWHMGYTWLWAGFPAFQLADIVGFIGFNDIGLFFNALFLLALIRYKRKQSWIWPWATVFISFAILNALGAWRAKSLPAADAKTRVLIVQANVGNQEKLMAEAGGRFRDVIIERFERVMRDGLEKNPGVPVDFAVWPETAFPELILEPTLSGPYPSRLREMMSSLQLPLITGGYSILSGTDLYTNSFFILDKNGTWSAPPYHKTVLLAFGEYIPFGDVFPIFYKWLPYTGHFGRGPGPTAMDAGTIKVGAQICYEGLFDWFTRGLAQKGAHIVVNVTNDSWYGTWEQPYQHLYMTLARAVEVRRPLVRSTNTGISGVIWANGDVQSLSPLQKEWSHLYEIPYISNPQPTPFTGWSYWLMPAALAALLGWIFRRGRWNT